MEIPGARVQVDSFKRGSHAYFLTHFHSDHMANLRAGWSRGPLYASSLTCRLLKAAKKADPTVLREIEPGQTIEIESLFPIKVTAFDANHCPGAVMFVFDTPEGRYLHTGDFRYDAELHAPLAELAPFKIAYVDATYAAPNYVFPPQKEIISYVVELARRNLHKELYLGLYTVGKTRIVEALVNRFGRPFYVTRHILNAYKAMGLGHLVTGDRHATSFFGYNLGYFSTYFKMANPDYRRRSLVIIPTGWAVDYAPEEGYHYVPYSEHCDWRERRAFLKMIRARRVVDMK